MSGSDTDIRFGAFRLSPRERSLITPDAVIPLGGRAFDLLQAMLSRPGELITKDELLTEVWAGVVVEENNLQVQVAALRRALGPHHGMIQTVAGRGYRFVGDMSPTTAAAGVISGLPVAASQTNLPAAVGGLIGRQHELDELAGLLPSHRLVTITGASGVGKTGWRWRWDDGFCTSSQTESG